MIPNHFSRVALAVGMAAALRGGVGYTDIVVVPAPSYGYGGYGGYGESYGYPRSYY